MDPAHDRAELSAVSGSDESIEPGFGHLDIGKSSSVGLYLQFGHRGLLSSVCADRNKKEKLKSATFRINGKAHDSFVLFRSLERRLDRNDRRRGRASVS